MFRIDHPTAATALPAPAPAGTPGYFQGGDPAAGTPRTVVTQDWANVVQEELAGAVVGAGLVLSKTDNGQLLKAIQALITKAFTTVFGGNGYVVLPGGLILQWGHGTTVTGSGDTVYFPTAFPGAAFLVLAQEASPSGWNNPSTGQSQPTIYGTQLLNAASFQIWCAKIQPSGAPLYVGSDAYSFIAIGH